PKEEFDVAPYAIATAEYLLQFKSSYNLPRKYKIVFSGCSEDCAYASVADLGFFAHNRDGEKGFAVYAGGGLGSNPAVAVKIEEFVGDDEFLQVAEAIKRLFDEHGDRANKHKARLRYVLKRFGQEEFIKMYIKKRKEIKHQSLQGNIPEVRVIVSSSIVEDKSVSNSQEHSPLSSNIMPEKTKGLFTVRVNLKLGDISADDLIKISNIAKEYSQGLVRTTQLQNLLLTLVSIENIDKLISALKDLSIDVFLTGPELVACTGAATCKLGLCLSKGLATAISEKLDQDKTVSYASTIRISGCPNSCGNHYIANIGFEGKAKRIKGRLMPFYEVLVGAKTIEETVQLISKN
ncbi:MAG: sulfurtransferase TusA family protein, partial [Planctomycetota bacterium]